MTAMTRLLYRSQASATIVPLEIEQLLKKARIRNRQCDVTGLLLYSAHGFMQYLEGPDAAVDRIYTAIGNDPRHRNIRTLLREPATAREFPGWSMAYRSSLPAQPVSMQDMAAQLQAPEASASSRVRKALAEFLYPDGGGAGLSMA